MKIFRVIVLLCILVLVAFYTKLQRLESTSWAETLPVVIYPINGDAHPLTEQYIAQLSPRRFNDINVFFEKHWARYSDLELRPVKVHLQTKVDVQPPKPPTDGNMLKVIFWSLRLRLWSYQHSVDGDKRTVNIFVRYHQPNAGRRLAHSLGLQKGLIGVVNAYAVDEYQGRNNVVIAHELLHTVGASDKYDMSTGQPIFPDGFAKPEAKYPQFKAEVMAGKIPRNKKESSMPESLRQCIVGDKTAREIGWVGAID